MIEVVAGLICDKGKFLIGKRPSHKARGDLWEFVGGKVERNETKEDALIRECREELGVTVSVGEVFMELCHEYPDITIRLTLFRSEIVSGSPALLEHSEIAWISPSDIDKFSFCPADEAILDELKKKGI